MDRMRVVASSRGASPFLMACPATLFLLFHAIVNGVPFFYPDAFVYFHYGETAWQKLGTALPDWPGAGVSPGDGAPGAAAVSGAAPAGNAPVATRIIRGEERLSKARSGGCRCPGRRQGGF